MTSLLDALSFAAFTYQARTYDYEYIGPGKNAVPWFDLLVLGVCVVAIVVVVRGVIDSRRNR